MLVWLAVLGAVGAVGFALAAPAAAAGCWILLVATTPDNWANGFAGYETIIGAMKAAGIVILAVAALRYGARTDQYNPGIAFLFMFSTGLAHGLYPGLGVADSVRSLIGSAAPFAFGFVRMDEKFIRAVVRAAIFGPLFALGVAAVLWVFGLGAIYDVEQGALRLGAVGEPPFLAGFALVAVYAGLMREVGPQAGRRNDAMLAVNFLILLLTGARAPLALAAILAAIVLLARGRVYALAAAGAVLCVILLFAGNFGFLRVVTLSQLGEVGNLSNRNLVWPFFEQAIAASPWVGWGAGAGKVIVPLNSTLQLLIGTNAAHDEYLRLGAEGGALGLGLLLVLTALWVVETSAALARPQRLLMRGIFIAFAVHSATDNTLIATTGSVFFIWVCAIFRSAGDAARAAA